MDPLIDFLATQNGRIARIAAGVVIAAIGLLALEGAAQIVVILIGLLPIAAGVFDFCLFAPLVGKPFSGEELRSGGGTVE